MVRFKSTSFSHKQMKYLNDQLNPRNWRVSWSNKEQWAIVPRSSNPLWGPLLARLPQRGRRDAMEKRRGALKSLASHMNSIVSCYKKLPKRKKTYVSEPRVNKLVREIFEIVLTTRYSVLASLRDAQDRLPRAKAFYSKNFDDQPNYVQEIIKNRQREKMMREK